MRNLLLATAAVAAIVSATSVSAADLMVDEMAMVAAVPTGDWSGAYVGGHLGYANSEWIKALVRAYFKP